MKCSDELQDCQEDTQTRLNRVTKPRRSTSSPLLPPARLLYLDFISCLCPEVSGQTNRRPAQLQCTGRVGCKSWSCESNKLPDFETKRQRWIGCLQPDVQTATCRSVERLEWSSENKRLLNTAPLTHCTTRQAETPRTAEYVIESHVAGHVKAPHPQRAEDK